MTAFPPPPTSDGHLWCPICRRAVPIKVGVSEALMPVFDDLRALYSTDPSLYYREPQVSTKRVTAINVDWDAHFAEHSDRDWKSAYFYWLDRRADKVKTDTGT